MFTKKAATIGAAMMSVVLANAAAADTFTNYGQAEGWNVFVDVEKMSCLIEKSDDAGNVVQMGLTTDRSVAYVGVFTKAKTKLGWAPKTSFKDLVEMMIKHDLKLVGLDRKDVLKRSTSER